MDPWGCVVVQFHEGNDVCVAEIDRMFVESLKDLARGKKTTVHSGNQFSCKKYERYYVSICFINFTVVLRLISLQKELSKHFITMSNCQKIPRHYK